MAVIWPEKQTTDEEQLRQLVVEFYGIIQLFNKQLESLSGASQNMEQQLTDILLPSQNMPTANTPKPTTKRKKKGE